MNKIKYLMLSLAAFVLVSCETYKEPDIEYSPVYPIAGEYIMWISEYDAATGQDTLFASGYTMRIYNTSANTADSAWVKISTAAVPFGFRAKVACDVKGLSFSNTKAYSVLTGKSCSITEGKVLLEGASKKPSGVVPDSVRLVFEQNGRKFTIAGFRRTQWYMDEPQ
jgi:hypothetical protein